MHLQQYRHASRRAEDYYREALRRDAGDSRSNTAMAEWHLRRGEYGDAERHLRTALERLALRNTNPRDGEASYLLGLALRLQGRLEEADDAFGKAGWNGAFAAASDTARAEIAVLRGDPEAALRLLDRALAANAAQPAAQGLRAALLRRAGNTEAARAQVAATLAADPLDVRALHEQALLDGTGGALPGGAQAALDVAHEEARAGLLDEAVDALERALAADPAPRHVPLLHYTLAWLESRRGDGAAAARQRAAAAAAAPEHAFPARLEEIAVLEWAIAAAPHDPRAPYYLGNLLYDKRRYHDAIALWRRAARLDPAFATAWRNLGIAEFNVLRRPGHALAAYRRAFRADATDARVLYELDQLRKRLGHAPAARLRSLERQREAVRKRDDLGVEFVALLNRVGRHGQALAELRARRFHPWEGGEGLVSAQWLVANRELARMALRAGDPRAAAELVRRCDDLSGQPRRRQAPADARERAAAPAGDVSAGCGGRGRGEPLVPTSGRAAGRPRCPGSRRSVLAGAGPASPRRRGSSAGTTVRARGGGPPAVEGRRAHPLLRHLAADVAAVRGRPQPALTDKRPPTSRDWPSSDRAVTAPREHGSSVCWRLDPTTWRRPCGWLSSTQA